MLKGEITPFASANRVALEDVKELLTKLKGNDPISMEEIEDGIKKLATAQRAFDRFEVCAHDEWGMKERALERVRHCRLNHRQQES